MEQDLIENTKKKLKEAITLEPIEQEELLSNLAKDTKILRGRLKQQLDIYLKEKRLEEENKKNANETISNLSSKIAMMLDKKELAERIIEMQPCYYDKGRNWWLWHWQEYKWIRVDETDILNAVERQATINTINSKERNEILEALKQVSRLNAPAPIKKTWIQFRDEIYDIETGERFKAKPCWFTANPIPYQLSNDDFIATPTMDKIFEEWVGKDNVRTLYEILAYCLLPDYPLHRIFCFIGAGLNGKGCYLRLLRKFIGMDNICSTELDLLLSSRFGVSGLHKKLVCEMGETNFNEMSKTSILKKLTGGDLIGFEYKGKDTFEDENYAKILIATNNLPTTTDKTIGFYRRWMIIDFPNQFSEEKDILSEIPEEEYNALALKCCLILKDILEVRKFTNEGSIEERTKKYEDHSDPLEKFMKEFVSEDFSSFIFKFEFEKRLNQWCKENRFRELSEVAIGKKMKEKGIIQQHKQADWYAGQQPKSYRAWLGIKWKGGNLQDLQDLQANPTQFHICKTSEVML